MNISKDTAKRMLANIEQQLQSLAQEQQSLNGNKGGSPNGAPDQFCWGGRVKMEGPTNDPYNLKGTVPDYTGMGLGYMNMKTMGTIGQGQPTDYIHNPGNTPPVTPWRMRGDFSNPTGTASWNNNFGIGANNYTGQSNNYVQPREGYRASTTGLSLLNYPIPRIGMGPFQRQDTQPVVNNQGATLTKPNIPYNAIAGLTQPDLGSVAGGYPKRDPSKIPFGAIAGMAQPNLGSVAGGSPVHTKSAFDWNKMAQMAPGMFNSVMAAMPRHARQLNAEALQNPYEQQAYSQMPTEFNINSPLNDARSSLQNYNRNVNSSGNSRGELMANYGAGMNRYNEQVGSLYAQKNNMENQYATNRAQMLNEQGVRRAGIVGQVAQQNMASAAIPGNMFRQYAGAAASDLGQMGSVNRQMNNQQTNQDYYMKVLMNNLKYGNAWMNPGGAYDDYRKQTTKYGGYIRRRR